MGPWPNGGVLSHVRFLLGSFQDHLVIHPLERSRARRLSANYDLPMQRRLPTPTSDVQDIVSPTRSASPPLTPCRHPPPPKQCQVTLRTDKNSATGTRTRVARVRAEYPNQLDYSGFGTRRACRILYFQARTIQAHTRARRKYILSSPCCGPWNCCAYLI